MHAPTAAYSVRMARSGWEDIFSTAFLLASSQPIHIRQLLRIITIIIYHAPVILHSAEHIMYFSRTARDSRRRRSGVRDA